MCSCKLPYSLCLSIAQLGRWSNICKDFRAQYRDPCAHSANEIASSGLTFSLFIPDRFSVAWCLYQMGQCKTFVSHHVYNKKLMRPHLILRWIFFWKMSAMSINQSKWKQTKRKVLSGWFKMWDFPCCTVDWFVTTRKGSHASVFTGIFWWQVLLLLCMQWQEMRWQCLFASGCWTNTWTKNFYRSACNPSFFFF